MSEEYPVRSGLVEDAATCRPANSFSKVKHKGTLIRWNGLNRNIPYITGIEGWDKINYPRRSISRCVP